jgi:hypothetical protein
MEWNSEIERMIDATRICFDIERLGVQPPKFHQEHPTRAISSNSNPPGDPVLGRFHAGWWTL